MPVPASETQFASLSTTDSETKATADIVSTPAIVSPTKSLRDADSYFESDEESSQGTNDSPDGPTMLLSKTEHKIMEEQGLLKEEPLLKENPHRFVIFPIQDNDVSA